MLTGEQFSGSKESMNMNTFYINKYNLFFLELYIFIFLTYKNIFLFILFSFSLRQKVFFLWGTT